MTKKETLRQILGSETKDKSVHGQALLQVLDTAADEKEAVDLLSIILLERDSAPKRPQALAQKGVSQENWDEVARLQSAVVKEYAQSAFFSTNTVEEFAGKILLFLRLFDGDDRIFAFSNIVFSTPYVPYQNLPGKMVRMTQREFNHILETNPEKKELVRYIVKLPFSTTVELGSMLLQVIDDTNEKEVRVALLGLAFVVYLNEIRASLE